jgi:DNA repair protein RecN (Recombination protein N)
MLKSLSVRNFVLLSEADLEFGPGFTAVTGETGAGKSILINALKLLLGAKAKSDLIRRGADKLRVEGVFEVPPSPELRAVLAGLELDAEDEITLERELTPAGKSRARVNGTLVALGDLAAVAAHLVDLHGQHEQQGLLDAASHAAYLDGYGGLASEAAAYRGSYAAWRESESALQAAEAEAGRLREQLEFLKFQLQELDKADPSEGEEERVEAELKMFAGLEKVAAGRHAGLDALEGNGGALPALARLQRELQGLERHLDPALLAGQSEKTAEIRDLLSGLRVLLRGWDSRAGADPGRSDAWSARRAVGGGRGGGS